VGITVWAIQGKTVSRGCKVLFTEHHIFEPVRIDISQLEQDGANLNNPIRSHPHGGISITWYFHILPEDKPIGN
jgi:hypothetical protein